MRYPNPINIKNKLAFNLYGFKFNNQSSGYTDVCSSLLDQIINIAEAEKGITIDPVIVNTKARASCVPMLVKAVMVRRIKTPAITGASAWITSLSSRVNTDLLVTYDKGF
jgi:hypothetical protein